MWTYLWRIAQLVGDLAVFGADKIIKRNNDAAANQGSLLLIKLRLNFKWRWRWVDVSTTLPSAQITLESNDIMIS
jgi:hypothetical protein